MPCNAIPFGYTEGDLDSVLASMGFSQEEITSFYGHWREGNQYHAFEKVVGEAVRLKNVQVDGWVMGEWDSFGPLSRGAKLTFADGRKVCAYYG